jgi:hypothetical protein
MLEGLVAVVQADVCKLLLLSPKGILCLFNSLVLGQVELEKVGQETDQLVVIMQVFS